MVWRAYLRERSEGWFWECFDASGNLICCSRQFFRFCWQALRDLECMLEDHWALMRARF